MGTTHIETVSPDWVDYNGHMNVAYYVLVFDHASDTFLDAIDMGERYRNATDRSTFVVESHVTYQAETNEGDTVQVETRVLGVDGKKIHLFHRMTVNGGTETVATNEVLGLHVNLKTRRAEPMPEDRLARIQALMAEDADAPVPVEAGSAVALVRK